MMVNAKGTNGVLIMKASTWFACFLSWSFVSIRVLRVESWRGCLQPPRSPPLRNKAHRSAMTAADLHHSVDTYSWVP